jgi:hypothetical protein
MLRSGVVEWIILFIVVTGGFSVWRRGRGSSGYVD